MKLIAKTFQGLEDVLAEELRALSGVECVEPGRRMVAFEGDQATLYRANLALRTALRVLKPVAEFRASNPDELYARVKEFDWSQYLTPDKTFSIDPVVNSDDFPNSRFVTYRVKDAIVDWFQDRHGEGVRPGVRLTDADVQLNVHIAANSVTLSLDSSGESLHKRGYRVASTDAPINEVLAAGIILKSGWKGDMPLVDPMCGSGTFLIEAALIAANIMPGVYRQGFAFEKWPDFDQELFDSIYNDDSAEREPSFRIYGADVSAKAVDIAQRNIKSAGVGRFIDIEIKNLSRWDEAPDGGIPGMLITNPPYGERIAVADMEGLYRMLGSKLKNVFRGYHAWVIGYRDEYFAAIGLAPSSKEPVLNGSLECELRQYVIFDGDMKSFRASGGSLGKEKRADNKRDSRNESRKDLKERGESKREFKKGFKKDFKKDFKTGSVSRKDVKKGFRKDAKGKSPAGERIRKAYDDYEQRPQRRSYSEAEAQLSRRRNEHTLEAIKGVQPSLPPQEGTFMRIRRGWKKPKE